MARANRFSGIAGTSGVFHLTHRCYNRAFLLKFARDRDTYRAKVWEHLRRFNVAVLDYCITSNHVHLLVDAEERLEVSGLMREVGSEFARAYNRRKGRSDAFWGDNYHATLVKDGPYLWRCVCYIELNMVRCGAVAHPSDWLWRVTRRSWGIGSGIGWWTWSGCVGACGPAPGRGKEESGSELGGANWAAGCQKGTVLDGKLGGRKPWICGEGQTADLVPARNGNRGIGGR